MAFWPSKKPSYTHKTRVPLFCIYEINIIFWDKWNGVRNSERLLPKKKKHLLPKKKEKFKTMKMIIGVGWLTNFVIMIKIWLLIYGMEYINR